MQRRPLGRSGIDIPRIVLGGMFRDTVARETELRRALDYALDCGLNAIDTAPLYEFGASEQALGRLLKGRREQVCLMTKVGLRWDGDWGDILFEARLDGRSIAVRRDSRPEAVRRDVDESLARLGCDTLDLVQVHHRDRHTPIADTMGELLRLREEGKLRAVGVSNFSELELVEAQRALGAVALASIQNEYSLLERSADRELLARARSDDVAFLAYSPLARGVLAGRMLKQTLPAHDGRRSGALFQARNLRHINRALEEVLDPIARRLGAGLAEVALAWVIARPGVTAAIVGAQNEEQVRSAIIATKLELTEAELATLADVFGALPLDFRAGIPLIQRINSKLRRVVRKVLRS